MTTRSEVELAVNEVTTDRSPRPPAGPADGHAQLAKWGAVAGLAGVAAMVGTVAVVVGFGLPDASDPETLTDFSNIESGRIAEHFLYLGALILFGLHIFSLNRLLRDSNPAAALFGTVTAGFGLVIMAASSMLHISTAPLAELYSNPEASAQDQRAIEYAWHGTQSIFDTMLGTGLLLVPLGFVLLGVAMRSAREFGIGLSLGAVGLGIAGFIGAALEAVDPASDFSAAAVLAMVLFHLAVGWWTLTAPNREADQ